MGGQSVIIRAQDGDFVGVGGGALAISPVEEVRIDQGVFFGAQQFAAAVADAASIEMLITVPSGTEPHVTAGIQAGGDAQIAVFENTTVSASGTGLVTQNFNRRSSNTPTLEAYSGPTITADGDQILDQFLPGGSGTQGKTPGGQGGIKTKVIFADNRNYLIRLTNNGGSPQPLAIQLQWYEQQLVQ